MMRALGLGIVALACAGCSVDGAEATRLTPGDPALYADYVQPYVEARCASLDCHGDRGRPLRLYAELGRRSSSRLRTAPISERDDPIALTGDELAANQLAFAAAALANEPADQHLALLKPLPVAHGGVAHEGGAHWSSKSDPGYLCLRGYLVGDVDVDVPAQCSAALDTTTDLP